MKRVLPFILLALACGGPSPTTPHVSRDPISVRGWITDVEGAPVPEFRSVETEVARRQDLFQSTNVWIDDAPYVSGGVAPNGSFILLDVPPGNITISFAAPNAPVAHLVLERVPGNADVFIPGLVLKGDSVSLVDPKGVKVRLAARMTKPTPTGTTAIVAGVPVPVMNTPMAEMIDRLDYPNPPSGLVPLATVK